MSESLALSASPSLTLLDISASALGDARVEALLRVLRRRACGDSIRYLDLGRNRMGEAAGESDVVSRGHAHAAPPTAERRARTGLVVERPELWRTLNPWGDGDGWGEAAEGSGMEGGARGCRHRGGHGAAQSSTAAARGYFPTAPEVKVRPAGKVSGHLGPGAAVSVPITGSRSGSAAFATDAAVREAVAAGSESMRAVCRSTGGGDLPRAVHASAACDVGAGDRDTWGRRAVQWEAGSSQVLQAEGECAAVSACGTGSVAHLVSPFDGCQGCAGARAAAVNLDEHWPRPVLAGGGAPCSAIDRAEALASRARAVLESRGAASPIRPPGHPYRRPPSETQGASPPEAQHGGVEPRQAPPREGVPVRSGDASRATRRPRMAVEQPQQPSLPQPPSQPQSQLQPPSLPPAPKARLPATSLSLTPQSASGAHGLLDASHRSLLDATHPAVATGGGRPLEGWLDGIDGRLLACQLQQVGDELYRLMHGSEPQGCRDGHAGGTVRGTAEGGAGGGCGFVEGLANAGLRGSPGHGSWRAAPGTGADAPDTDRLGCLGVAGLEARSLSDAADLEQMSPKRAADQQTAGDREVELSRLQRTVEQLAAAERRERERAEAAEVEVAASRHEAARGSRFAAEQQAAASALRAALVDADVDAAAAHTVLVWERMRFAAQETEVARETACRTLAVEERAASTVAAAQVRLETAEAEATHSARLFREQSARADSLESELESARRELESARRLAEMCEAEAAGAMAFASSALAEREAAIATAAARLQNEHRSTASIDVHAAGTVATDEATEAAVTAAAHMVRPPRPPVVLSKAASHPACTLHDGSHPGCGCRRGAAEITLTHRKGKGGEHGGGGGRHSLSSAGEASHTPPSPRYFHGSRYSPAPHAPSPPRASPASSPALPPGGTPALSPAGSARAVPGATQDAPAAAACLPPAPAAEAFGDGEAAPVEVSRPTVTEAAPLARYQPPSAPHAGAAHQASARCAQPPELMMHIDVDASESRVPQRANSQRCASSSGYANGGAIPADAHHSRAVQQQHTAQSGPPLIGRISLCESGHGESWHREIAELERQLDASEVRHAGALLSACILHGWARSVTDAFHRWVAHLAPPPLPRPSTQSPKDAAAAREGSAGGGRRQVARLAPVRWAAAESPPEVRSAAMLRTGRLRSMSKTGFWPSPLGGGRLARALWRWELFVAAEGGRLVLEEARRLRVERDAVRHPSSSVPSAPALEQRAQPTPRRATPFP